MLDFERFLHETSRFYHLNVPGVHNVTKICNLPVVYQFQYIYQGCGNKKIFLLVQGQVNGHNVLVHRKFYLSERTN